jgi:cytochrome P450
MMGLVMAGSRSTGNAGECYTQYRPVMERIYPIPASWLVTYLGCYPNWRDEARTEVRKIIASHSPETISECDSPHCSTTIALLSSIPLAAWENETPVLDMLIHETLRIAQPHVAMRQNIGPDMYIDGKTIPTGSLVVYPFADVHLDQALYPDPWKFDPARPKPTGNLTYLGWGGGAFFFCFAKYFGLVREVDLILFPLPFFWLGVWAGRTTCLGSRLARLEIKLLAALMLVDFDFETVDASGRVANPPPTPNWNGHLMCQPVLGRFFLKYKRLDSSEEPSGH